MDPGSRDIHIIFSLLKTTPLWDSALRVSYPLYSSVSVTRLTLSVNVTEELNRLSALITYERDKRKPICFPTLCCNAFRKWPRKEGLEEQTQSRLWHKIMSSVVFVTALLFGKLQTTFFFFFRCFLKLHFWHFKVKLRSSVSRFCAFFCPSMNW